MSFTNSAKVQRHIIQAMRADLLGPFAEAGDTDAETTKLRQEATRLGVEPEDLARAAVTDLLSNEDQDFRDAAEQVLRKNEELYRRLA